MILPFGLSLAAPWALLLLPLPLLALRYGPPARARAAALAAPETVLAMAGAEGSATRARVGAAGFAWAAWIALVLALAGPRTLVVAETVPPTGRDLMLAIDLSGSMEIEDFLLDGAPARRVDVVRRLGSDFVRGRWGDRVGVVVFGDQAMVAAPPSFDVEAAAQAIEVMDIGVAGRSTAISYGLGLALKRLADADAPSRVVILLSDGTNTAGDLPATHVARLAAEMGVRVHTIAMGPLSLGEGSTDRNAVDDLTLADIARASGGETFRVKNAEDFAQVNAALDRLEATEGDAPTTALWREWWPWPAAAALAAALAAMAARNA
jgi:Ca-activated chloride channel family protein